MPDAIVCPGCGKPHPLAALYLRLAIPPQLCGPCRRRKDAQDATNRARFRAKCCRTCNQLKHCREFNQNNASPDGLMNDCKACDRAKRLAAPCDARHGYHLRRNYGITREQYNWMLEVQGGVCAICRQPETTSNPARHTVKRLAVDHDHRTGQIRGLLCSNCNRGIGHFHHDPSRLRDAIAYLTRSEKIASRKQ